VVLKAALLGFGPACARHVPFRLGGHDRFNRMDFGVSYGPKILGEDVTVNISIEAGFKKA